MGPVKRLYAFLMIGLVICSRSSGRSGISNSVTVELHPRNTLFNQSAAEILDRDFIASNVSFLLLDARTGGVLASRWDNPEKPIPMGSLVKPFTALAYAEAHGYRYPQYVCRGTATGCWRPGGHGLVDITSAIAESCNSYFRLLSTSMTAEDVLRVSRRFGVDNPGKELSDAELIGIGNRWLISPIHIARAYLELARRRQDPGVPELLAGMSQSSRHGTGSAVGRQLRRSEALVKTGTAGCTHQNHAPGDGFVVALVPASEPDLLLLVRVHGVPGATAAQAAGQMLHRLEE
jgi:cell division protein FtsI/penicillin-binding protein 2